MTLTLQALLSQRSRAEAAEADAASLRGQLDVTRSTANASGAELAARLRELATSEGALKAELEAMAHAKEQVRAAGVPSFIFGKRNGREEAILATSQIGKVWAKTGQNLARTTASATTVCTPRQVARELEDAASANEALRADVAALRAELSASQKARADDAATARDAAARARADAEARAGGAVRAAVADVEREMRSAMEALRGQLAAEGANGAAEVERRLQKEMADAA
eukprot:257021-Chlamydomonas_euryale.AAC.3